MTPVDLAYLAGHIDTRGVMQMTHFGKGRIAPRIEISDTQRETLEPLTQLHGRVSEKNCAGRTVYAWLATYRNAQNVVRLIRPYLRIRTAEADAILRWVPSKPGPKPRQPKTWALDGLAMTKAGRGFQRRAI